MWVNGVSQIRNEVFSHFSNMYSEVVQERPSLDRVHFEKINDVGREMMVDTFSFEEVENIV